MDISCSIDRGRECVRQIREGAGSSVPLSFPAAMNSDSCAGRLTLGKGLLVPDSLEEWR
jgi:hypothetical protein